jgi:hypothetical protein
MSGSEPHGTVSAAAQKMVWGLFWGLYLQAAQIRR